MPSACPRAQGSAPTGLSEAESHTQGGRERLPGRSEEGGASEKRFSEEKEKSSKRSWAGNQASISAHDSVQAVPWLCRT